MEGGGLMYCLRFFSGQRKFWILNHLRRDEMKICDVRHQWRSRRRFQRFARAWIYGEAEHPWTHGENLMHPAAGGSSAQISAQSPPFPSAVTAHSPHPKPACWVEGR